MKRLRTVIFWGHLATGVAAGLVVLVMSVTGVLLAYERQIVRWADARGHNVAPPASGATRLPVETLVAKVRESRPSATPASVTLRSDPASAAEVSFGREGTLFVNPYTGEVLGEGSKRVRGFFQATTDLHRWLGAQGENRAVGRAVTGACNLGFLFLVMSGFYLWWPRGWTRGYLRGVTWFRRGLSGRARDFNWHNTVGFWSAVPLFVIVLSGVVISYVWAGNLVYRIVGEAPPPPRAAPAAEQRGQAPAQPDAPAPPADLERLWARAEQQQAGWRTISLRLPSTSDKSATFTIDQGDGGQPQKRAQLTLDRASGEVVRWEPFASYTLGRRLRSYLRFAHTGEAAGLVGQTIAALASAGAALLVFTGLLLAWRRLRVWAARRARAADALQEPAVN